jgi:hypothetical protein
MENEIYKDIPGFEGYYQASNFGRIKRLAVGLVKKEKIIKSLPNGTGYFRVILCRNGVKKSIYVHRAVAAAFHNGFQDKLEVNHLDGDKSNNRAENLTWTTRASNQKHRYDVLGHTGVNKGKLGAKNWNSKPVNMYDLKGNLIKTFAGGLEAQRETGINESCIRCVIYGRQKTAGGYFWKRE